MGLFTKQPNDVKNLRKIYDSIDYLNGNLRIAKKDGKCGIIEIDGVYQEYGDKKGTFRVLTECIYDKISETKYDRALAGTLFVNIGKKCGLIDAKTCEEVLPCEYDGIGYGGFHKTNLICVKKNGKFGMLNRSFEEVLECIYDEIEDFKEGYAVVKIGKKRGLIDETGKVIVECKYDFFAGRFEHDDTIHARIDDKWGVIHKSGKVITECKYDFVSDVHDEFIMVELNDKYGLIDKTGKEIVECKYDGISDLNKHDLFEVRIDGKYGLIDKTGKVIIECKFKDLDFNESGLIRAREEDGHFSYMNIKGAKLYDVVYAISGYSDSRFCELVRNENGKMGVLSMTSGEEIIKCEFDDLGSVKDDLAYAKKDGKYGYIDKTGKVIIEFMFENVGDFHKGLAKAKKDGKYGLIDKTGKEIINFEYEDIRTLYDLVLVKKEGKWGLINRKNKVVLNCTFDDCGIRAVSEEGFIDVVLGGKKGIIDKTGKIIVECKYDYISVFDNDGYAEVRIGDDWGIVDKTGKEVIECKYMTLEEPRARLKKLKKLFENTDGATDGLSI